jgi:hypothetical protein
MVSMAITPSLRGGACEDCSVMGCDAIATDIHQEPGLSIFRVEPVGFYLSKLYDVTPRQL